MHSSENLYEQLSHTLYLINEQIAALNFLASTQEVKMAELRAMDGTYLLTPLLVAKANALNGMTTLLAVKHEQKTTKKK